jgi:hypothetical protein
MVEGIQGVVSQWQIRALRANTPHWLLQAAIPDNRSMNRFWPRTSPFGNHRICPFRMMFVASYPRSCSVLLPLTGNPDWP